MTRARRVGAVAAAFTISYLLVYFSLLSIPFVSEDVADQMIPTVRFIAYLLALQTMRSPTASLVATRFFWIILSMDAWHGYTDVQGMSGSFSRCT